VADHAVTIRAALQHFARNHCAGGEECRDHDEAYAALDALVAENWPAATLNRAAELLRAAAETDSSPSQNDAAGLRRAAAECEGVAFWIEAALVGVREPSQDSEFEREDAEVRMLSEDDDHVVEPSQDRETPAPDLMAELTALTDAFVRVVEYLRAIDPPITEAEAAEIADAAIARAETVIDSGRAAVRVSEEPRS